MTDADIVRAPAESPRTRPFGSTELRLLDELIASADEVVTLAEGHRRRESWPERFMALRVDSDNDPGATRDMAQWLARRGICATFMLVQGDRLWGPDGGRPSAALISQARAIAALGHEIGLKNDSVSIALATGADPHAVLAAALESLRAAGIVVRGTVGHRNRMATTVETPNWRKADGALAYLNSDMFSEARRPGLPESLLLRHVGQHGSHEVTLTARPLGDHGLDYEAGQLGHTLLVSDGGGRLALPAAVTPGPALDNAALLRRLTEHFSSEGGFLQLALHPCWWSLDDDLARPPVVPTLVVGGTGTGRTLHTAQGALPEWTILVRGDCCSRRAISMNPDLFGGVPHMIRDEKSRTDFHLDHLVHGSPSSADIAVLMDTDAMPNSLRTYALHQVDREVLAAPRGARLLVMDSYADMQFRAWRHREHGWKIWNHNKFMRDRTAFEREWQDVGALSLEETVELTALFVEQVRLRQGDLPVLYLMQPIEHYPRLRDTRANFHTLGALLEPRIPNLFFAAARPDELELADIGSAGGPGNTLHFGARTYRAMIESALRRGLAELIA